VLLVPDISKSKDLDDTLKVIGLSTDYDLDDKYCRSNLFNNNYAILLAAFQQYKLYTTPYIKEAFSVSCVSPN
jgi:hypothetical protein